MPKSVKEHPAVEEAEVRLARLRARKRDLEVEFRDVRLGPREPSVEELAEEVHAGGTVTATETRSAAEVQKELRATERAIQRARQERNAARSAAREEILREVRPRYERVQHRMAKLARRLLDAAEDELALTAALEEAGVKAVASGFSNRLPEGRLRSWLERAEDDFNA